MSILQQAEKLIIKEQKKLWGMQADMIKMQGGVSNQLSKLKDYGYKSFRDFRDVTGIFI